MMDMQAARNNMVEGQVRPNQVHDGRVIAAMRALPREAFAPPGTNAYADIDLPRGKGRFMLAPMTIGRMAQLVLSDHPEHVLVIAAGSGYGAALLAAAGVKSVVALEEEARLDTGALARWAPGVMRVAGPLTQGWPPLGPYDAIMIEGAVADIPAILTRQLKKSGRVVTILANPRTAGLGAIVVAEPSVNGFACRPVFDCTARLLPAFRPAPVFEF